MRGVSLLPLGFVNMCRAFLACYILIGAVASAPTQAETIIAEPAMMLVTATRYDFVGTNTFAVERWPQGKFLRSTPNLSATGLYQKVTISADVLHEVRWHWSVETLHRTANLQLKSRDDFGAMIAFVFGEPKWWNRDVPTIAYVWTSTPIPNGSIQISDRLNNLRYIQLRGTGEVGKLQQESRNVVADFVRAFGTQPPQLEYVAVFNDNDQTKEPASAAFGTIYASRPR